MVRNDPDLLGLILFGSIARGEGSPVSDIDLCLVLMPGAHTPLEISGKKLEYAAAISAQISIFQQLPLYVRQSVLQDGKIIFCRDTDGLYEIAFATIREFADFEPTYLEYLKEVADAG